MIGNEMFLLKRGCGALGLDEIVKDILDKKDNTISMEFTKCIGELLRNNGVVPKITEVRTGGTFDKDRNVIEERYGVLIEGLDFSEHDKVFEDKISEMKSEISILKSLVENYRASRRELISEKDELKQRISELENENMVCVKVLATPMEIATYLIDNTCTINELEMIAEHLLVYCKHNKESE